MQVTAALFLSCSFCSWCPMTANECLHMCTHTHILTHHLIHCMNCLILQSWASKFMDTWPQQTFTWVQAVHFNPQHMNLGGLSTRGMGFNSWEGIALGRCLTADHGLHFWVITPGMCLGRRCWMVTPLTQVCPTIPWDRRFRSVNIPPARAQLPTQGNDIYMQDNRRVKLPGVWNELGLTACYTGEGGLH